MSAADAAYRALDAVRAKWSRYSMTSWARQKSDAEIAVALRAYHEGLRADAAAVAT